MFGQENWCFRLFNLLVASVGLYYFDKIARRLTDTRSAWAATVIFGVSIAFMYARKGMPDVFAVSLALMGVHFGWQYIEDKKMRSWLLFVLFTAVGLLCKMPASCVLGFLIWPAVNQDILVKDKIKLASIVDAHVPKDARILVNNRSGSPIMMYSAHRTGWTVDDRMKDAEWVRGESTVGLHYIVIERSRWKEPLPFQILYQDNDFQVYKVN